MSVIVDCNIGFDFENSLKAKRIKYFKSFNIKNMYFPVNTHPDMQIHFVDKNHAVVAPIAFEHYKKTLPSHIKLYKGYKDPGNSYPTDCAYNVAKIGKKVVGNFQYVDNALKEIYSAMGYEFINVKQGYAKCNLCIIGENRVITEDEGLYKTLSAHDIKVLKISSGGVALPMFSYGFIGGASGMLAENKIAFYGDLKGHSDYFLIKNFIKENSVDIINLSSTKLTDFGSIIYFE